jgi:hypothetical protein
LSLRTKSSQIIANFAASNDKEDFEIDEAKQILTRVRRVSDVILSKKNDNPTVCFITVVDCFVLIKQQKKYKNKEKSIDLINFKSTFYYYG